MWQKPSRSLSPSFLPFLIYIGSRNFEISAEKPVFRASSYRLARRSPCRRRWDRGCPVPRPWWGTACSCSSAGSFLSHEFKAWEQCSTRVRSCHMNFRLENSVPRPWSGTACSCSSAGSFLPWILGLRTVFRIHDILVWIRIRIHRSMPLTNGSGFGSGSCYFRHWPSRRQQKTNLKKRFFCLLLFEGTFTSFFKDEKCKRSHKTVGIKVFFTIFCLMIEGSGSGSLTNESGSGRPKKMWIRWIPPGSGSKTLLENNNKPSSLVWIRYTVSVRVAVLLVNIRHRQRLFES